MSIKYNTTEITPKYPNTTLSSVYYTNVLVWTNFTPITKTFSVGTSLEAWTVPSGTTKLQVDCVASKGGHYGGESTTYAPGNGGRVQCYLSVTAGQVLYFVVGNITADGSTASYNASDIRTNNAGITDTTSLNSRLVVAGGGANSGSRGKGGAGGGLEGERGWASNNTQSGGYGGTQTAGGSLDGTFGLGGNGHGKAGCGGAGWYGGGYSTGGSRTYGGGGGSSYTNSTYCTNVTHTQGYQNGAGYITIITMNS